MQMTGMPLGHPIRFWSESTCSKQWKALLISSALRTVYPPRQSPPNRQSQFPSFLIPPQKSKTRREERAPILLSSFRKIRAMNFLEKK